MNLNIESNQVEEIKSFKITATFLITNEMLASDKTFTVKELFEALTGDKEEIIDIDEQLIAIIKTVPSYNEDQVLNHVKTRVPNKYSDVEIRRAINSVRGA